MRKTSFLVLILTIVYFGCRKDKAGDSTPRQTGDAVTDAENAKLSAVIRNQTTASYLKGRISDEQGLFVPNASVTCAGKTVTTDTKGYYKFDVPLQVNSQFALVSVTKAGYLTGLKTWVPNTSALAVQTINVVLLTTGNPQTVPEGGGAITVDQKIRLEFPAAALVRADGSMFHGNYKVFGRYINPQAPNFPDLLPGVLMGLSDEGMMRSLQSFGMAQVQLTDSLGNKLEVAPGVKVKMELPATAGSPASVPLWHFNELYGVWIQSGSATRTGNIYSCEVNHFSPWNVDVPVASAQLTVKFQTTDQVPLSGVRVWSYSAGQSFYFNSVITDNNGQAIIPCPQNQAIILKTIVTCDTILTAIAPLTQNQSQTITLSPNATNFRIYNFAGTLYGCSNQPLANTGFEIRLYAANTISYISAITDAQGKYAVGTVGCDATSIQPLAQAISYYASQNHFSILSSVNSNNNIYNPVVCDTLGSTNFTDNQVVTFADLRLESTVRQAVNRPTGLLYYIDVKNLRSLYLGLASPVQGGVISLSGLEYCTSLRSLFFTGLYGGTLDLTALQNLSNLDTLYFDQGNFVSLSPLQSITSLKYLNIRAMMLFPGNPFALNLQPLQTLVNLRSLSILGTGASDISFIRNMINLHYLDIRSCTFSDLSPLAGHPFLDTLFASSNPGVSNISPLSGLTGLKFLTLGGGQVQNISALRNLTALTSLEIGQVPLSDITPLAALTRLDHLALSSTQVSNLTPLQGLTSLNYLYVVSSLVADVTPVRSLTNLKTIYLPYNSISTIQPWIGPYLPQLTFLSIADGNSMPSSELNNFRALHPGCSVN